MNRWNVYEWMKYWYMEKGIIPTQEEARRYFRDLDPVELEEGMAEFLATVTRWAV